ncbi:MAG: cobalt ECF transporter T component CbiQ [Rhodospirillaceae bacterium]|nr:cobalt ECF transporter T component CbiQ [Rhodospirillaceae bacterium]
MSVHALAVRAATIGGPLARLDPRSRVLAAVALVVTIATLHRLDVLLCAVAGAGALALVSGQPLRALGHRLLHLEGFMAALLLLLPFTMPGAPLLTLGPIAASEAGVLRSLDIVLTVNGCALVVFALLAALDPVHLGQACARLGVPQRLVQTFLLTVRYGAVFRAEIRRLTESMRVRGFAPGTNRHTFRTYGNLAGMVLVRSLERAERVDEAMRCRGYSGRLPIGHAGRFGRADLLFGFAVLAAACALVGADRLL